MSLWGCIVTAMRKVKRISAGCGEIFHQEWMKTTDEVLVGELTEAVKSLPEWAADAIMLFAVYGCSVQETAVILGVSRETAKKRIQRASSFADK